MATFYSHEYRVRGATPPRPAGNAALNQRERLFRGTIRLDTPASSDTASGTVVASGDIVSVFRVPAGTRFVRGFLTSSVSLGTSTIAIGVAGNTAKYRAAATFTAVNTPTTFGTATAMAADELQADEEIIITVAAANLPNTAGERLVVDMIFSAP